MPQQSTALREAFLTAQSFTLDPYQLVAIEHLLASESVLVSAPTGAGKTVIAEFAIWVALQAGQRCIYTTPLKALSNQKFRDLRQWLPEQVGLLTGDVVIEATAPVLVMTTEILRNILQSDPERLSDVSHVILDEAHYLGSEGRGTVWEETIVFLSKETLVVALSATIPNATELAAWVSAVHRPMAVVSHTQRPVPLDLYVATPNLQRLFTAGGKLAIKNFQTSNWGRLPDPVEVIGNLQAKRMLPAIYFVFSRLGCEQHALDVIAADLNLTSKTEAWEIGETVRQAVQATPGLLTSASARCWLDRLPYGIAPHHAGLLPPLKLIIEKLFQRGLVKVVFATETLAAGINMPARTVVLSNLLKRTDDGLRMLTVSEFHQMTGRAGRRGMDRIGHAVVLAGARYSPHDLAKLARDPVAPLRSRFTLNFHMVANLTQRYDPAQARRIVEQSFSSFQSAGLLGQLLQQHQEAMVQLKDCKPLCPVTETQPRVDLLERHRCGRSRQASLKKRVAALEADGYDLPASAADWDNCPEVMKAREKLAAVSQELAAIPCASCGSRHKCEKLTEQYYLLQQETKQLTRKIEQTKSSHWREFQALQRVLQEAGYLRDRQLLARGVAIAHLRTTNELMAAECVVGGWLEALIPGQLTALVSCIVAEPPRGRQTWYPLPLDQPIQRICRKLTASGKDLLRLQRKHAVDQPVYLVKEYAGLVQAWAEGAEWPELIATSGIDEGQLVRHLRQVIDLLQQLKGIPGASATLGMRAHEAIALLDRDIVCEVF
ncbi:MAG: DEAD/DEAH box helicase [Cyanobacteria bacterium NC_groundwater_1444_Ag_S-0.65um_54_12]|nr:DEAD/DEAH box helicase [Cyanobacteria bacterium NC_groundwater_1444_Ag_S-0.65um_54_12]